MHGPVGRRLHAAPSGVGRLREAVQGWRWCHSACRHARPARVQSCICSMHSEGGLPTGSGSGHPQVGSMLGQGRVREATAA